MNDILNAQEQAQLEAINESAPTIATSMILSEWSIGVWEGTVIDKKQTDKVLHDANASPGAAKVQKTLLGKSFDLEAIKKHRGHIRNHIQRVYTVPWLSGGIAAVSTELFPEYTKLMTEAENKFWNLVDIFVTGYDQAVMAAQNELQGMWNASDYPSSSEIRNKFHFTLNFLPLDTRGDFRIQASQQTITHLSQCYQELYNKKVSDAMRSLWDRLEEPLRNMSVRLDYEDKKDKTGFKDTLVENVLKVVQVMKGTNINGDAAMARATQLLEDKLKHVTPDALRADPSLRRDVKMTADEVLKAIDNLPSIF